MTAKYLGIKSGDTALLCLSTAYIAGKMMVVRSFVNGWHLLTIEPTANPFYNIPIDWKIDFCAMVPMQLQSAMMESADALAEVNKIIVGGAPLASRIKEELANISVEVYETFGMTETISHIAMRKLSGKKNNHILKLWRVLSLVKIKEAVW